MDPRMNEHEDQPNQRINQILDLIPEEECIDLHREYKNYIDCYKIKQSKFYQLLNIRVSRLNFKLI